MNEEVKSLGFIDIKIENLNLVSQEYTIKNTVLRSGRYALAKTITNDTGEYANLFVEKMVFGINGIESAKPKIVNPDRNSLFGPVVADKYVLSTIDPSSQTQAIFTTVLGLNDGNGYSLNEMALLMNNGDYYSMATFPDINKTDQIQITFNWRINYI
jgi:hypothetical protein